MNFDFQQPKNLDEAVDLLAHYGEGARILAGGAALVPSIQQNRIHPRALVSLENISALRFTRRDANGLHLGAMNSLRSAADSSEIQQHYPALSAACGMVGNVRVRNQATLGGNLALADYASDPPAVLSALDASVTAASPRQARQIPLVDLIQGHNATALEADELLSEVFIPALPPGARQVYLKYKSRSDEDRPCVGVAAVANFEDSRCSSLRVAVGAACPRPFRSAELEHRADGRALDDPLIAEIAAGYAAGLDAVDDLRGSGWYHRRVARVLVRRALEALRAGRAGGA